MKYEPWARLTTRITPKMSESPLASRNRSAPYDGPLKVWVTQNSAVTGARPHSQVEQTPRVLRQDAGAVPRGQLHAAHDDLARPRRAHVETEIAADHHPVGPDEADQVRQRRRGVTDRVVREAPEVGVERALGDALRLGPHPLAVGEPADEVRHGAAGVRQAGFQLPEAVRHAAKNGGRGGARRVARSAEEVVVRETAQVVGCCNAGGGT